MAYYEVLCAWLLELYTKLIISLLEASGFLVDKSELKPNLEPDIFMTEEERNSCQWNSCKPTESIGPTEVIPVTISEAKTENLESILVLL